MITYDKFTLDNGLRVLVYNDKTTPMVAFNILYDVGARDETPDRTGFAHLFEHLMFGGSKNIKNFDTVLQKAGGENNAFTNNDHTNYYITVPKQNLETAFYLDSDRMLELAFSKKSLDVQRNVVSEEFRQRYFNQPYGDVSLYLRPLAYKVHPYQWSTIGKEISHITGASLSEVKEFFYKYYAPNNAVLVIGGDVETAAMEKLCKKWFGDIPRRNVPERNIPIEPAQNEKRTLELVRDVPADAIYMAYHMCSRTNKDYHTADLISDILSNGRSSFFNKNLIKEKKLFPEVEGYIQGSRDPGLFMINAKLYESTDFITAEKEIKNELNKIITGDFSEHDLEKVKNKCLSSQLFSKIGVLNITMELAYYEWLGNAEMINEVETRILEVNKASIMRVAAEIFRDSNLNCIYYKSKNNLK